MEKAQNFKSQNPLAFCCKFFDFFLKIKIDLFILKNYSFNSRDCVNDRINYLLVIVSYSHDCYRYYFC